MDLKKLDSVLNKLEMIACYCIEHEDGADKQANKIISHIDNLTIQCINELDEIVPRPLPKHERGKCKVCNSTFSDLDMKTKESRPDDVCSTCFTSNA